MWHLTRRMWLAGLLGMAFAGWSCGRDELEKPGPEDTIPPASVTNLALLSAADSSLTITWTAPGDDGSSGVAAAYAIRHATSYDSSATWFDDIATAVAATLPTPAAAGETESLPITHLLPETTYYIALKAIDEAANWSALSNILVATTTAEQIAPAAIADLATASVTDSSITLTWTAPGDDGSEGQASAYDLRLNDVLISEAAWDSATALTGLPAPALSGTTESFTVTGLAPATTYYFAIKSADEVPNWSPLSNALSATTAALPQEEIPPSDVIDLAGGSVTDQSVMLSWTAPGDDGDEGQASTYDLRYATATITLTSWDSATVVTGLPAPSAAGEPESFAVVGLDQETTYYFALRTADEVPNWSGLSNIVEITTLPEQISPAFIEDLSVGTVTTTSVALNWTAPGDDGTQGQASEYDIRYATSEIDADSWYEATEVADEPTPALAGSAESYTVSGLSAGTLYYFAVKAADEVPNWSKISNVVSATTASPDTTAPATITDITTYGITHASVGLTWTAPGDDDDEGQASAYDIRYDTAAITSETWESATPLATPPTPSAAGAADSVTVSGLAASTAYYFAIKTADEAANWSAVSTNATATTTAEEDPPADIADLATGATTDSFIVLTWTAPGDDGSQGQASSYDIRYATAAITTGTWESAIQATGEPTPATAGSAESFTVTGLAPATTYHFAVKTADEVPNWSGLSNGASATTEICDETAPAEIGDLATGAITYATVALTWTAPGDDGSAGQATSYDLRYATSTISAGNWAAATQVSGLPAPAAAGSVEAFTVTGLTAGSTYYFALKSADEVPNWSDLSNVVSAETPNHTILVEPDGSGDVATIQDAVTAAVDGDVIELANGTFTGTGNRDVDLLGKEITIRSQSGTPSACTIDCQASSGDRHRGFILQSGESANTVIRDITITDAYAGSPSNIGGAILCGSGARCTITHCTFTANHGTNGGAIGLSEASGAAVDSCTFSLNQAATEGGGIYASISSTLTISNCTFNDNTGGSIAYYEVTDTSPYMTVTACTFSGNDAAAGRRGGAIVCSEGRAAISTCSFRNNQAYGGGAIYVKSEDSNPVAITDCLLAGNYADDVGGALLIDMGGAVLLTGCTVSGNYAADEAGGIMVGVTGFPSDLDVDRCIIYDNCAETIDEVSVGTGSSTADFDCSCVSAAGIEGIGLVNYTTDMIYDLPDFSNPAACTSAPTSLGDYRLLSVSPCLPTSGQNPCGVLIGAPEEVAQGTGP